jgi:hypothetical protein
MNTIYLEWWLSVAARCFGDRVLQGCIASRPEENSVTSAGETLVWVDTEGLFFENSQIVVYMVDSFVTAENNVPAQ